jgi:hypothetical protein
MGFFKSLLGLEKKPVVVPAKKTAPKNSKSLPKTSAKTTIPPVKKPSVKLKTQKRT